MPGTGGKSGAVTPIACTLLVIGHDRDRVGRLRLLLQQPDLAIDAQHPGHFRRELGIAAFQVIAHLVRLHLASIGILSPASSILLAPDRPGRRARPPARADARAAPAAASSTPNGGEMPTPRLAGVHPIGL